MRLPIAKQRVLHTNTLMTTNEKSFAEAEIETEQNEVQKMTFRQAIAQLPEILMVVALKRFGIAAMAFLATLVMLFISKDWYCCGGFLISLLAVYLGLDIIWKFAENKILIARTVVCKVHRGRKGQLHVTLRDANVQDIVKENFETIKVDINANARDRDNIIPGTVMDIYFCESAPNAIIAYELLGDINI